MQGYGGGHFGPAGHIGKDKAVFILLNGDRYGCLGRKVAVGVNQDIGKLVFPPKTGKG